MTARAAADDAPGVDVHDAAADVDADPAADPDVVAAPQPASRGACGAGGGHGLLPSIQPREGWSPIEKGFAVTSAAIHAGALVLTWLGQGGLPLRCTFRTLAGVACPTCGTTRALLALDRGDLAAAFAWNPVGALVGVFQWGFLVYIGWSAWTARAIEPGRAARAIALYGSLGALAAVWAVRLALGTLP